MLTLNFNVGERAFFIEREMSQGGLLANSCNQRKIPSP